MQPRVLLFAALLWLMFRRTWSWPCKRNCQSNASSTSLWCWSRGWRVPAAGCFSFMNRRCSLRYKMLFCLISCPTYTHTRTHTLFSIPAAFRSPVSFISMGTAAARAHIASALSPTAARVHTHHLGKKYLKPIQTGTHRASYLSSEVTGSQKDDFNIHPHTLKMERLHFAPYEIGLESQPHVTDW